MKRCAAFVVLLGMFALAQAAPAPEAITIKMKVSAEGDSTQVSKTDTQTIKVKIVDGNGKVLVENDEKGTDRADYKETILKRDGKKSATKLEREYTKAEKKKGEATEDLGLNGKTVVIEQKDGKYLFTFKDGKAVPDTAAAALTEEFSKKKDSTEELERLMLPKGPVKAGDEWKLDVAALAKELDKDGESELDAAKATGTGKLSKVYTKDGKQFGEMHFKVEMPVKSLGKGNGQMKFADGAKMLMDLTLDTCIDGTSDAGTMKMKMSLNGTGSLESLPGSTVSLDLVMEGVLTQKEPAKK